MKFLQAARTSCRRLLEQFASRRSLARLLSTFLCSVIIVIRPFSILGGNYAYLVLALKELVFSAQETLAQQLELTVLNITGALLGIGFSTLAKYIASLLPYDSAASRAICAVFLIIITFCAGLFKSRLIRLQFSCRISCFVSIWLLTINIGEPSRVLADSGNFLWITLSAAIISLVSLIIVTLLFHSSPTNLETEMTSVFGLLREGLTMSLSQMGNDMTTTAADAQKYQQFQKKLLSQSIKLNEMYSQAAFELRIGRLNLKTVRPLIGIVEDLRRELAWGMEHLMTPPDPHRIEENKVMPVSMEVPTTVGLSHGMRELGMPLSQAILQAIRAVEHLITAVFHQSGPSSNESSQTIDKEAIQRAKDVLVVAREVTMENLKKVLDKLDADLEGSGRLSDNISGYNLALIALLQMAETTETALDISKRIATRYEEAKVSLWCPRLSLSWLGVPPGPYITNEDGIPHQHIPGMSSYENDYIFIDPKPYMIVTSTPDILAGSGIIRNPRDLEAGLSRKNTRETSAERELALDFDRHHARLYYTPTQATTLSLVSSTTAWSWKIASPWSSTAEMMNKLWSLPSVVRMRRLLSAYYRAVRHSNHLKHAMKNAIGVAILTFPAFMPADSAGRKWFIAVRGEWMTISYLWVLETNTGATWRTGYLRLLGTFCGALYAYIMWLVCRTNPYGLVTLVTLADVPITWLTLQSTVVPMACPASVAIPPIAFAKYIVPDTQGSIFHLAVLRFWMIAMGILAALAMNGLIFPRHCRVIFLTDTSRTLGLINNLYITMCHDMFRGQQFYAQHEAQETPKLELRIRSSLHRLSVLIVEMDHELSLLPKPLLEYRETVNIMQKLLDILTGLRKIRKRIPREETVFSLFHERREFMSRVCITIFTCLHAFRAREPLPQFMPSARHALAILQKRIQDRIRNTHSEDPHSIGSPLAYAFAEEEVMKDMVTVLERLLNITSRLFGSSAWLPTQHPLFLSRTSIQEDNDGWYSTFK